LPLGEFTLTNERSPDGTKHDATLQPASDTDETVGETTTTSTTTSTTTTTTTTSTTTQRPEPLKRLIRERSGKPDCQASPKTVTMRALRPDPQHRLIPDDGFL
jgi:hypothetical protein